jgi:hypothetical protein
MKGVKTQLGSQVASFFDIGIQKLIPRYDKCLNSRYDYTEKSLSMYIFLVYKKKLFFSLLVLLTAHRRLLSELPAYDGNQNHHAGDLTEHRGHFFHNVAYSRCDILSEMFYTVNIDFSVSLVFCSSGVYRTGPQSSLNSNSKSNNKL